MKLLWFLVSLAIQIVPQAGAPTVTHVSAEPGPPTLEQTLAILQQTWRINEEDGVKNPRHLHITANRIRSVLCDEGKTAFCPYEPVLHIDIDRLAYAVAVAETKNCTQGTGITRNNCHGISKYGHPVYFRSHEDSFKAFKKLWLEKYGDRFPTLEDARLYTGNYDTDWLNRVTVAYNETEE